MSARIHHFSKKTAGAPANVRNMEHGGIQHMVAGWLTVAAVSLFWYLPDLGRLAEANPAHWLNDVIYHAGRGASTQKITAAC